MKRLVWVIGLSLTLVAGAWAAKGGKGNGNGGGGDDGGGNPSKLQVLADFEGPAMVTTAPSGLPYADNNLNGGWANMPGTGNFTLQLNTKNGPRELLMDFSNQLPDPAGEESQVFPHQGPTPITLFLSMNRICAVGGWDPGSETCSDSGDSEGSLKAMKLGGPDLLINFRSTFEDPAINKANLKIHCGPNPVPFANDDPTIGFDLNPPDAMRATCELGRAGDNACMQWLLQPASTDGSLTCRAMRQQSSKGQVTYTNLGLYDMPFTLTLQRDENGNGVADCEEPGSACISTPSAALTEEPAGTNSGSTDASIESLGGGDLLLNVSEPGSQSFIGLSNGVVKSPVNGRLNACSAKLDVCFGNGHQDVPSDIDFLGCISLCDTGANNGCDAQRCVSRCEAHVNGSGDCL